MSRRSTDAGRQPGLTRSSSSSSSSSTSTSSSSSSSHHIRAERSRSRSSSGSSRSRSRTRSRERHYSKREDCTEDDRNRSDARIASRSRQQQQPDYEDQQQSHNEDSSSDLIDDSIRSDKSSKSSSSNGRYGDVAAAAVASQRDSVPPGAATKPSTKAPALPSRISKTAIQFGKPGTVARPGIHMKLSQGKPQPEQPKKITVASAFNNDSDDEVEEMPPECKMRMRNIGRDTPTSSGPNSFGKTKQGFIDSKKLFEKSLRQAAME